MTKFNIANIDADVLRYRCGFAVEYTLYHVEGLSEPIRGKTKLKEYVGDAIGFSWREEQVVEPPENAIQIVKNYIAQIERIAKCKSQLIISGPTNFRDAIATIKPYKGNRPDRKPKAFGDITNWMLEQGAIVTQDMEADDLLAIKASCEEGVLTCSVDKDLWQVPGWHYDYVKDKMMFVDEYQAYFNLCVQILAGDPTDNVQGIPKIGVKKAEQILQECVTQDDMFRAVAEAYEAYYGDSYQHFLDENASLVYLLRYPGDKWDSPILPEDFLDG